MRHRKEFWLRLPTSMIIEQQSVKTLLYLLKENNMAISMHAKTSDPAGVGYGLLLYKF
jgi:transcription initiation factor IIE alpha subunit